MNAIKIGDILYENHPDLDNKIANIESVGRNKIRIKLKDWQSANKLLTSTDLKKYNLIPFVPKSVTHKFGIIKGIDLQFDDEYVKNKIKTFDSHCTFTVESVKRLHRKENDENGKIQLKPTKTILVVFKAPCLPNYIAINHVRIPVEIYEQRVILCYNCFRYGHLHKQCKSNTRCLKCKGNHSKDMCRNDTGPTCFYCEGDHYTTEMTKCPEFTRQKSIKKLMSEQQLSYAEANNKIPRKTYASVTNGVSISNLPSINQSHNLTKNNPTKFFSAPPIITHGHNTNHIQSSSQITQKGQKRARLTPNYNNSLALHKEIVRPITLPNTGPVFDNPRYKSNIGYSDLSNENCISLSQESLINLILSVLNRLKQQQSFEIQESALLNIIKNNLFTQSSDDELF